MNASQPGYPIGRARSHKDLIVWQISLDLAREIYLLTRGFPATEQFGLTTQLRRSAVSVSSNIAEGAAHQSTRDFMRFLYIARASLAEMETQLHLARAVGYVDSFDDAQNLAEQVGKMINAMLAGLRRRTPATSKALAGP